LRVSKQQDIETTDFGAHSLHSDDDYPDFVVPLGQSVAAGEVERGIAVCGSGVGASICANKVPGVRAGLVLGHFSARQGVEDDHMNIICLGGHIVGPEAAWNLIQAFLAAVPSQADRHLRRLGKVALLEMKVVC
jgi:ribose 5-phosphate isomerase B